METQLRFPWSLSPESRVTETSSLPPIPASQLPLSLPKPEAPRYHAWDTRPLPESPKSRRRDGR